MSKKAKERRLKPIEAMSKVRTLRTGARKLNLVAQSIRGLKVQRALNELEFSPKRIAIDVRKALYCAKACSYAQGLRLLQLASNTRGWDLPLGEIASIWRAGFGPG